MHSMEATARERKARALCAVLAAKGVPPEDAEAMSDGGWKALARLAGQREASPVTRRCVIWLLRTGEMPSITEQDAWKEPANASH